MIRVFNDPIPRAKMCQFHEILCATGGRYLSNPRDCGTEIRCDYVPGDYNAHKLAWQLVTRDVKEANKTQGWRRVFRRIKLAIYPHSIQR